MLSLDILGYFPFKNIQCNNNAYVFKYMFVWMFEKIQTVDIFISMCAAGICLYQAATLILLSQTVK